jgi:hypothetical protein
MAQRLACYMEAIAWHVPIDTLGKHVVPADDVCQETRDQHNIQKTKCRGILHVFACSDLLTSSVPLEVEFGRIIAYMDVSARINNPSIRGPVG